ncbi:LuxR C-terminal-related transcriptional regulator [Streptomyces echinatus]|uniref:LuxR C-terminal-related transcriptional regulator n=1 Tax=Streptomyces echinatus TaxID=67293 RepID=UPI0037876F0F
MASPVLATTPSLASPFPGTPALFHLVDTPALVGRDRELAAALSILTSRSGPGGVLLAGPAGIGKSRLGHEIASAVLSRTGGTAGYEPSVGDQSASAGAGAGPLTAVDQLAPGMVLPTVERLLPTSSRRSRLLWIDDAHLLSPQAIEALLLLAGRRSDKLLIAVNTDEAHPHLHALWKDQHLARLDLAPLDVLACRRLAGALLADRLTQSSVARLARMSAGNPLLLRELVRAALAQDLLVPTGGWWHLREGVPLSDALRDLVVRSLKPIGAEARHALELIALAEPARLDILEDLVGLPTLLTLEDHGLIQSLDPRRADAERPGQALSAETPGDTGQGSRAGHTQPSVGIAHPYLGHVLRQDVAPLRRKHYLLTWTAALPQPAARPPAERVRLAQWHLDVGDTPEHEDLLAAARHALAAHELPAAYRLAGAAWRTYRTAEAAELKAHTLLACAAFDELDTFAASLAADHPAYAPVLDPVRARALVVSGRYREAEEMTGRLPAGDAALVSAMVAYFCGHLAKALRACAPLREDALPGHRIEAGLLTMVILCRQGRPLDALEVYRRVREDVAHPSLLRPLIEECLEEIHAVALLFAGRLEEAENNLVRAFHDANRDHALRIDAQRGLALGCVLYERGRPRQALTHVTFTPAYQVGWQPWQLMARIYTELARSCLRPASGARSGPDVLADVKPGHLAAALRVARARAAHRDGDETAATRALHEAVDDALTRHAHTDAVMALHECARLGLAPHPAVHTDHPLQGPFLTARLHYARAIATGDATLLGRAARALAEVGAHLYAAEGYAELARLHRRAGRDRAATTATAEARIQLEHCDDVATPPLHFLGETASLSPRERTIARLAAQGLTDKEIAGQLVVSPRTVSNTLYRVYQKTGATDRRHLRRLLSA